MRLVQTLENLEPADIVFSDSAAKKVSDLIQEEKNDNLKLYILMRS
jgi:iron-sulfur cluster insertion protein